MKIQWKRDADGRLCSENKKYVDAITGVQYYAYKIQPEQTPKGKRFRVYSFPVLNGTGIWAPNIDTEGFDVDTMGFTSEGAAKRAIDFKENFWKKR